MYKIMLVDDDSIARMKLKNLLQWEALNCQIAAEASNGKEAVAKLQRTKPDIIITDIDMPGMSGVDLIQYVQEQELEIYILALSAYDDFDFVRDSLKYGAQDYILKHQMTPRKLEAALQEAFEHIQGSKEEAAESNQILESDLLDSFLQSDSRNSKPGDFLLAVGSLLNETAYFDKKRLDYLKGIVKETLALYEWKVSWKVTETEVVLLFVITKNVKEKDLLEILEQIQVNSERYIGIRMEFSFSQIYQDASETKKIYECLQLKKRTLSEEIVSKSSMILQIGEMLELERFLRERNPAKIEKALNMIFDRLERQDGTMVQLSIVAVELCNILQRNLLPEETSQDRSLQIENLLNQLQKKGEIDVGFLREKLLEVYLDFVDEKGQKREYNYANPLLNEAIAWIEQHCEETISLRDVAENLSVNSAYLSRLFKKYTGKTIVTFINELKMKKAKALIEEGELSLKEISYLLGFQNYNYFHRLFKEIYGNSPSSLL